MPTSPGSRRTVRHNVNPSIFGMSTSLTMAAGCSRRASASPSSPSPATRTLKPALENQICASLRSSGSSSTTIKRRPEGKITDVNEGSITVTGVPREQLIGTDFSDYFTEPKKAREGYQQVFAQGFVMDYPLTIRHKDGKLTDVLYNASVYKDARGNVLGVFAAARNVTDSKRVMREFTETKNLLDNILQSSIKYSLIGKDLEHRILSWNEGAQRNYGYAADEILGKNSEVLHTREDVASGAVKRLLQTA